VEYDPQPPFDCGSVETASAELVTSMRALRGFILNGAPRGPEWPSPRARDSLRSESEGSRPMSDRPP
jgi:hypothetical protein